MTIVSPLFIRWDITKYAFRAYIVEYDGKSILVKSLYKFISVENNTIPSVSSDDVLHAFLVVAEQQM